MKTRGITKADFDYIASVIDSWWGGLAGERANPVFFYELGEHALIAEENAQTLGFLLGFLVPSWQARPKTGYVHLVGIHPDHRRRGVGKALYERFIERARHDGATLIKAIAALGNEGSIRFHEAMGFSVAIDPDYAGKGRGRMVFTKQIA